MTRAAGGLLAALLLLAGLAWSAPSLAQGPAGPWSAVPGAARDLAIAPSGEVYAAGVNGALWRWRAEESSWVPLPGTAARLAAGPGGRLWGVRADGVVVRYEAARWQPLPGPRARDVALDAQGEAYAALEDGSLARWNTAGQAWTPLPGRAHRLAVHPDGSIWTLAEDGAIARHAGEQSEPLPGRARDLAIAGSTVAIASTEGRLERWNPGSRAWEEVPGAPRDVAQVALAPDGAAWTATASGAIVTQAPVRTRLALGVAPGAPAAPDGVTFNRRGSRGAGGAPGSAGRAASRAAGAVVVLKPPAATTDPAPFEFVDTLGTASRLAIGQDGSVFAIAPGGALTRWSNARRAFVAFPGSLVRIAVDAAGSPWGVNQAGRVFRHTGTDWRQVRGTASDIAVAARGRVMTASASGALAVYDPASEGFVPTPGELYFLALDPQGVPWGLLKDGTVLRCAALPCERVGFDALNIAIGPDGSVFIVNFANELRRFNAVTGLFDFIPVPGHVPASVAVGPFGRPWVVTTTGKVLSSRFFERDESVDLQTAAATSTPTTGSGDVAVLLGTTSSSGFSYSKSMQFTSVGVGCATTDDIAVGVDGTVIVVCDNGGRLMRYNAQTKALVEITSLPTSASRLVDVDSEGRLWIGDGATNGRIYRQRQKNGTSYDTLTVPVTSSAGFARDLAIGPDNTVYYIDGEGTVYRRTSSQTSFSKMISGIFFRVAVGVANDVWLLDPDGVLYQLVGGQLEKRPASGSPNTNDVGGGADGSIYATQFYSGDTAQRLYKWNASNRSFDRTNREADRVDVAPDGRPWVANTSQTGDVSFAR